MGNIYTGSNSGKAGLNVKKADDTVDVFGVSQIQLGGNMTLVNNQNGSVTIDSTGGGGSGGVTELSFGSTGFLPATSQTGSIVMTGELVVGSGGTGVDTLTDGGILLGSGTGAITATSQPTNGQLLIGSTGADPVVANLTGGTGITISEGAGTLTINADNNGTMTNFKIASSPLTLTQTVDDGNTITFAGGTGLTAVVSATDTVTIDLDDTLVTAASYTNASITVDAQGRLTSASSGTAPATGTGVANQVTYWDGASTITGDSGLTWNPTGGSERFTMTGSSASDMLRIVSTSTTTGTAPDIAFVRDRSYLAGLDLGILLFKGPDADESEHTYAYIKVNAKDGTVGGEKGTMDFRVGDGTGTNGYPLRLSDTGAHFNVINATGLDVRMDTASTDNAFLLDASANTLKFGVNVLPFNIQQQTTGTAGLTLTIDDDGATASPDIKLIHNSTAPTANDDLGHFHFQGNNSVAATISYADFFADILDPVDNQEAGRFNFRVRTNTNGGNITDMFSIRGDGNPCVVVNDSGRDDVDFRVETDNQANAFLLDASADTATFNVPVEINQDSNASGEWALQLVEDTVDANRSPDFFLYKDTATPTNGDDIGTIEWYGNNAASSGGTKIAKHIYGKITMDMIDVIANQESGRMFFNILKDGVERQGITIRGDGAGSVVIGDGNVGLGANGMDFRVETTSQNSAFEIDTSADTANFNVNLSVGSLAPGTEIPATFTQASGDTLGNTNGGAITSTQDEISVDFTSTIVSPFHERHGLSLKPNDYQVITGKTTTQSFGQTQKTIVGIEGGGVQTVDCYPSQGGLIVVTGSGTGTSVTLNLTLGQYGSLDVTSDGRYDSGALPFNGSGQPTNTSDLPGYGTWQIGDQVTVLANLTVGQTPNITVRSYNSTQNGSLAVPSTAATAAPGDDPSTATKINGVLSDTASGGGKAITTNFTAMTFILCQDISSTLGVAWVAIG